MYKDYKILKRFFSRKNDVYLISSDGKLYVLKRFKDFERAKNEWSFLTLLWGRLNVPKPLIRREGDIWMEYIDGELISNSLNGEALNRLAAWLTHLHSLGIKKGDCILRNFIISKDEIYGVDWEEAEISKEFKSDLVDVCGSIIWIFRNDIRKGIQLCEKFLKCYHGYSGRKLDNLYEALISFFSNRLKLRPELRSEISRIMRDLEIYC